MAFCFHPILACSTRAASTTCAVSGVVLFVQPEQILDELPLEVAPPESSGREQSVMGKLPHALVGLHPHSNRYAEAVFLLPDDFNGEQFPKGTLEPISLLKPLHLQTSWKTS